MARMTTHQVKFVYKPGDLSSILGVQCGRRKPTLESSLLHTTFWHKYPYSLSNMYIQTYIYTHVKYFLKCPQ